MYLLWHISPGVSYVKLEQNIPAAILLDTIDKWYSKRLWIPQIEKYLTDLYGEDIKTLIMDYYKNRSLHFLFLLCLFSHSEFQTDFHRVSFRPQ